MVGLLEPLVAWIEDTWNYSRHKSTAVSMACIACLGVLSILSYNLISDWRIGSRDLNGVLDFLANQVMLPVGGLLIAVFAAWQMSRSSLQEELPGLPRAVFELWHLLLRFLLPAAIVIIIFSGLS